MAGTIIDFVLGVVLVLLVLSGAQWLGFLGLGHWFGLRRDDRMDRRAREDAVLEEFRPTGLPDPVRQRRRRFRR